MASVSEAKANDLLAALPAPSGGAGCRSSRRWTCRSARCSTRPAATLSHVYFPTTASCSLLYVMENGASAEIAVVGNEGIVGISLFMGGESTPSRAVVQSAGRGYRLKAQVIKDEFNRAPGAAPAAALHPGADHADGADGGVQPAPFARPAAVPLAAAEPRPAAAATSSMMTQELIANMLGVRREGVTEGARQAAEGRADPLFARPHHGARPRPAWKRAAASASGGQDGVRPPAAGSPRPISAYAGCRQSLLCALADSQRAGRRAAGRSACMPGRTPWPLPHRTT